MRIVAIKRSRGLQILRYQIRDVGPQRGPRVITLQSETLSSLRRPEKRYRALPGHVVVVNPGRRILIIEQAEVGGEAQVRQCLVPAPRMHLLIVVQAGPEIGLVARSRLDFPAEDNLLAGAE